MEEADLQKTRGTTAPPSSGRLNRLVDQLLRSYGGRDEGAAKIAVTVSLPHLRRARLALELADRAIDPVEPLQAGSGAPLAVTLLRESVYWSLTARRPEEPPVTLTNAFDTADREFLLAVAGDDQTLQGIRRALVERSFIETAEVRPREQERDARMARAFAGRLVAELETSSPAANAGAVRRRRVVFGLVCAAALGVAWFVLRPSGPPDFAAHKSWRTSSQIACDLTFGYCAGRFVNLAFHTLEEDAPWAELDLGELRNVSSIRIRNREDCCQERAVPLVVEGSTDHLSWRELGQKTSEFKIWNLQFPSEGMRYLRLTVPHRTMFHLKSVEVR